MAKYDYVAVSAESFVKKKNKGTLNVFIPIAMYTM